MTQTDDFPRALKIVLQFEGGWSNDPEDPGGATMYGVIQTVYDAYRTRKGQPAQSVRLISQAEVQDIYRTQYWLPVAAGRTWPLNAVLFDTAVNMGPGRAEEFLQQAKLTPANTDPDRMRALAVQVLAIRQRYYYAIVKGRPASAKFLRGWLNRLNGLRWQTGLPIPPV